MHKSKVLAGMAGLLVLIVGTIQGLALGGVLGTSLYENPPFLSGIIGGLIPLVSGVVGMILIAWGLEETKEQH